MSGVLICLIKDDMLFLELAMGIIGTMQEGKERVQTEAQNSSAGKREAWAEWWCLADWLTCFLFL